MQRTCPETESLGPYAVFFYPAVEASVLKVEMQSQYAVNGPVVGFQCGETELPSPCLNDPEEEDVEALAIYYKDVTAVIPGQLATILPFGVTLRVRPTDLSNVTWSEVDSPPGNTATLSNPNAAETGYSFLEVGGLYKFNASVGGIVTRTHLWLPVAAPDISAYWQSEIDYFKNTWGPAYRANLNSRTSALLLRPDLRAALKHILALGDMADVGGSLDWTGYVQGTETPCGGPNRVGDEFRQTMHGVVIDFRKRNNMLYALIGKEMGLSELELYIGPNTPWAVGAPDSAATRESYRAGFDLYDGDSLEDVMRIRGYDMQEPGSWSQKEWPSYETSQGGLNRAGATLLEGLIQ